LALGGRWVFPRSPGGRNRSEIEIVRRESIREGLRQTGQTMRLELAPENRHWFFTGWRPAIGWTFVLFAISFGSMLTLAAAGAALSDNARPLQILTGRMANFFGLLRYPWADGWCMYPF
jgi:hypothetical protein